MYQNISLIAKNNQKCYHEFVFSIFQTKYNISPECNWPLQALDNFVMIKSSVFKYLNRHSYN